MARSDLLVCHGSSFRLCRGLQPPVTFPIFGRVFGTSLEQMGQGQSVFFFSGIVFSLCGGWMIGRMGHIRGLILVLLAISASLTLIGTASGFSAVLLGAFCFGLAMTTLSERHLQLADQQTFCPKVPKHVFSCRLGGCQRSRCWYGCLGRMVCVRRGKWGKLASGILRVGGNRRRASSLGLGGDEALHEGPSLKRSMPAFSAMREVLRSPDLYAEGIMAFFHGLAQGDGFFRRAVVPEEIAIDTAIVAYFISLNSETGSSGDGLS